MKRVNKRSLLILLACFVVPGVVLRAKADIIYTTLGPDRLYVSGGSGLGVNGMPIILGAVAFTPSHNYLLTEIDTGIQLMNTWPPTSGNTGGFILGLYEDSNGLPGTVELGLWGFEAPPWSIIIYHPEDETLEEVPVCCPLLTATTPGISLAAEHQYWLVVAPDIPPQYNATNVWWAGNTLGLTGPVARADIIPGDDYYVLPPWPWVASTGNLPAFEVRGIPTPEPSSLFLLFTGLAGLAAFRRKRRS